MSETVDITKKNSKLNGPLPLPAAGDAQGLPAPPESYKLNQQERQTVAQVVQFEVQIKARVYDIQAQLEQARQDLVGASAQRRGAVAMLIQARGWEDGILSEDYSTLTKRDLPRS